MLIEKLSVNLIENAAHYTPLDAAIAIRAHQDGQGIHVAVSDRGRGPPPGAVGWGAARLGQQHYVRIYMTTLRRKLEDDPAQPTYLRTETGVGSRLADS